MKSELIVDARPDQVSIALLEDTRLMSLQKESRNIAYAVGDIYKARVKKLMPGLNAAFVNVGYERDAFLHYLDLGPHFASYTEFMDRLLDPEAKSIPNISRMKLRPDIDKHGSVTEQLESGRELLVQIVKEPISSKGPRLTTEITFTGRFLVLIPFSDKISISQKIKTTEEKVRLRQLIESIKPKNFGVIVRTSAEGKRVAELNHELKTLVRYWEETCAKARKADSPALVFEEESRILGMLRDVFSPSFEAIHVNDRDTYKQIVDYVSLIAPERADIVKLYQKQQPIFDAFNVTRQIKSSFGKTVSFKQGAYIIIEHTEALHVIDVNSGNRTKATNTQETNALEVNIRAADEIARQLRLRDMGGIIVIDFIDMNKAEHRQELYDHMREVMANDRARHNILPLSKFGLMQITRQRVRPVLDIATEEDCPSCGGTGKVQPSLLFTDVIKEKIEYAITDLGLNNFRVYVHPYVDAYLKKGWLLSESARWRRSLGGKFRIIADESLAFLQYRFVDAKGNEVDVKQEKDTNSATAEKKKIKATERGKEPEEIAADLLAEVPATSSRRKKGAKAAAEPAKKDATPAKAQQPKKDQPKKAADPAKPAAAPQKEQQSKQDKPKPDPSKNQPSKAEQPKKEQQAKAEPTKTQQAKAEQQKTQQAKNRQQARPADTQATETPAAADATAESKPSQPRKRRPKAEKPAKPQDADEQPAKQSKADQQPKADSFKAEPSKAEQTKAEQPHPASANAEVPALLSAAAAEVVPAAESAPAASPDNSEAPAAETAGTGENAAAPAKRKRTRRRPARRLSDAAPEPPQD